MLFQYHSRQAMILFIFFHILKEQLVDIFHVLNAQPAHIYLDFQTTKPWVDCRGNVPGVNTNVSCINLIMLLATPNKRELEELDLFYLPSMKTPFTLIYLLYIC